MVNYQKLLTKLACIYNLLDYTEHGSSKLLFSPGTYLPIQWNLDLSFFKGTEKTNDECGQTINPENYYTL